MENLLSLSFWFNSRPPHIAPISGYILISFITALFVLGFFFFIKKKPSGKSGDFYLSVWRKSYYFCLINFILGILLLFVDYEKIPFLSARFWYLLWLGEMIIWLSLIFKFIKKIPEKTEKAKREKEYKKYLP